MAFVQLNHVLKRALLRVVLLLNECGSEIFEIGIDTLRRLWEHPDKKCCFLELGWGGERMFLGSHCMWCKRRKIQNGTHGEFKIAYRLHVDVVYFLSEM